MTSHDRDFMNRVVSKIAEIDGGEITLYSGNYDFYERERAIARGQPRGRLRAPAGHAGQGTALHRALPDARRQSSAGAEPDQVARQDREASSCPRSDAWSSSTSARLRARAIRSRSSRTCRKAYGRRVDLRRPLPDHPPRRALGGHGTERRGQDDAPEDGGGHARAGLGRGAPGREPEARLLRAAVARCCSTPISPSSSNSRRTSRTTASASLRTLAGAFQFSGDDVDKKIRALSGGEKTRLVIARMLYDPPNFLVLDEPTNHLDLATKEMLVAALRDFEGTMLFVSHDREFLRGLSNRVLELGGESGTEPSRTRIPGLTRSTSHGPGTKRRACIRDGSPALSFAPAPTAPARCSPGLSRAGVPWR